MTALRKAIQQTLNTLVETEIEEEIEMLQLLLKEQVKHLETVLMEEEEQNQNMPMTMTTFSHQEKNLFNRFKCGQQVSKSV